MTYPDLYSTHLVSEAPTPEGHQHVYRFENSFGASVIRHDRGPLAGKWEMSMLRWDGDECVPALTLPGEPDEIPVFYHDTDIAVSGHLAVVALAPPPTGIDVTVVVRDS